MYRQNVLKNLFTVRKTRNALFMDTKSGVGSNIENEGNEECVRRYSNR